MTGYIQLFYTFLNGKAKRFMCRKMNLPFLIFCLRYEFRNIYGLTLCISLCIICEDVFPFVYVPFATLRVFGAVSIKKKKEGGNLIVEITKLGLLCSCHKQINSFF